MGEVIMTDISKKFQKNETLLKIGLHTQFKN